MTGIQLLVADWHGQYIPQWFASNFDQNDWNINEEDFNTILAGPDGDWYWEAWDYILNSAEYTDSNGNKWHLSQDGDLWAYCDALMTNEEYEDFFGFAREDAGFVNEAA